MPPPAGARPASPYARFIPREELGDFASWQPGTFGGAVPGSHGSPGASATAGAEAGAAGPAPASGEEWQARVAAARQTGYQEGYRDGLVALESFKQTFAQQATAQIGALLDAFDRQFDALDAEAARAVAQTAVQLARQVLRTELQLRPELVAQVSAEAVNAVMLSARHISVQVHPHDLPLVAEGAAEVLAARGARLQANPALERGGVLVQSDVGTIDARIASRWAQAAAALGSLEPLHGGDADPLDEARS
ncbi:MAG: flagellar assembly protein FliH [Rubrivivax sp.]|nr:flagellar assembly protein FliH [Rubrivivax sp.]